MFKKLNMSFLYLEDNIFSVLSPYILKPHTMLIVA